MAPKTYICSKEKELGEMATDIKYIKKDMAEIKSDNRDILNCIHSLKEELPKTYATNKKVDEMEKRLIAADKNQDVRRSKTMEIFINNLPWLISALALIIYNILKSKGLI